MDLSDLGFPMWNLFGLFSSGLGSLASIGVYVWVALCLYIIAKKTNAENAWLAWIPVGNVILACQIAGKPWWWVFLFLIPIANIVFAIIVMWKICETRNKPGWLSLLMFVPIANLVIPGILAFTD